MSEVEQAAVSASAKKPRKVLKRVLAAVAVVLVLAVGGFLVWASDFYHAESVALAVLEEPGVTDKGGYFMLEPQAGEGSPGCSVDPEGGAADALSTSSNERIGFVFYPGAKVQPEAYLPLMDKLRDMGISCFLVKMPLNMAIFNINAADAVMAAHPEIDEWYIGGHSMGGAMASSYAASHADEVEGLVLMGAYIYGDYPASRSLTIYGTFNSDLEKSIDYTDNIVVIDGGNHAQFGNYGKQAGDPDAAISAEEQQDQTVKAVAGFICANR